MAEIFSTPVSFLILLPIISFLYASVGHGGASGYLALMSLFAFPEYQMKQTALLLNLFVAGAAFIQFYRMGYFKKHLFLWFAIGSVPAAFWGGSLLLEPQLYKKILGGFLILAILRMLWFPATTSPQKQSSLPKLGALSLGGGIGFFSGLIGIGGGIILTPLLVLFKWASIREAAAVSALVIWVNSASGLVGQFSSGILLHKQAMLWVPIAFAGGWAGSYMGSKKLKNRSLEYFLALVLCIAALKLWFAQ